MTLKQIYKELCRLGYESDKGTVHSYIDIYANLLEPYKRNSTNILEIGLFNGHSLRMWNWYFAGATVYGIDCDIKPHGGMADLTQMLNDFNITIMDAENADEVDFQFYGVKFDVIIEDAGHHIEQQVKLYNIWKNYLNKGGIYIIEDVQDIDATKNIFENLDNSKEIRILDLRNIKGRYDDVLVIIKDK